MPNNDLTFCPLWTSGLYIEKVNQSEAQIGMCCIQIPSQKNYSSIDFYNNDYLSGIRNSIKNGKTPSECDACFFQEKTGKNISYRQGQIEAFKHRGIDNIKDVELISLLYNCENICNLKCITCGPRFSSLWRPEYKKLGYSLNIEKLSSNKNLIYEALDFSKLQLIHFQGGEPLITEDHEKILMKADKESNLSNITVSYNTNGTIFPRLSVIDLWSKTNLTKIYFSIDATEDAFHYIRYPADWQQVENNMMAIRDLGLDKIWIEIGLTISIANIFYLQDLIDWRDNYFNKDKFDNNINIYMTYATDMNHGGKVLNLGNINESLKSKALTYLNNLTDKNIADNCKSFLHSIDCSKNKNDDWINYLDNLDSIRNTNWKKSLFKLYDAI